MKILITGASGLIGRKLSSCLAEEGHNIIPFRLRSSTEEPSLVQMFDKEKVDAVINLAGENVASRWTEEKKRQIKESRIKGTKILCQALAKTSHRPQTLICASAIGYYGSRGDEIIDEKSAAGKGFLANLCQQWEEATRQASALGIRVVNLRIGVVLSKDGGALAKMLLPFQLGAGGQIADGQQYLSWIDIDDVIGAINYALNNNSLAGPVNAVAPHPVTNKEFTNALGKVLNRPTFIPIPTLALKILFGQMADELLLEGQKVMPGQLNALGYQFRYKELESSLRHLLNKA